MTNKFAKSVEEKTPEDRIGLREGDTEFVEITKLFKGLTEVFSGLVREIIDLMSTKKDYLEELKIIISQGEKEEKVIKKLVNKILSRNKEELDVEEILLLINILGDKITEDIIKDIIDLDNIIIQKELIKKHWKKLNKFRVFDLIETKQLEIHLALIDAISKNEDINNGASIYLGQLCKSPFEEVQLEIIRLFESSPAPSNVILFLKSSEFKSVRSRTETLEAK